ncbi:putative intracellular protein transport protein USO1-like [Capsicum annuum]|nr:putative intracellular protein transport protein USO1-like [Capsicum annuum]
MVKAVDSQGTVSVGDDAEANYRKAGTLPSDTVQNPRTYGSYMAITTRSGKMLSGPSMGKAVEKEVSVDKSEESNLVESEKLDGFIDMSEKEDDKKEEVLLKQMPRLPPQFPQRLKKKEDNEKFSKFMAIMKQLTVNVPLIEALEQMPNYAKFMKELLTKKRKVSFEPVDNIYHCGAVSSQSLVQKKPDPGAFTVPCIVGSIKFTKDLCDLGESINLMPLDICKKLGLREPTPTTMRLVMADRLVKRPVGILQDVPVKVDDFILPVNFVILDCDVDFEVPIFLGRPLLATERVLVDMELNELKFRYGKKEARFKMQPLMKQLEEMNIFSVVDVFQERGYHNCDDLSKTLSERSEDDENESKAKKKVKKKKKAEKTLQADDELTEQEKTNLKRATQASREDN